MSTQYNSASMLVSAMWIALSGCAANQQYRTSFVPATDPNGFDKTNAVIEVHPNYKLGFVEFDDQGSPWDECQRSTVEEMVRTEAGLPPGASTSPASKGIILVAFVHGWKDNAAPANDGVQAFRQILTRLDAGEKIEASNPPEGEKPRNAREVVGVYVGWRGLTAAWEPFKEMSFWDRLEVAHKVGGYGGLTRLLTDLENIQKESPSSLPSGQRMELIIIGHSMGAAAVYSAVSQIITARFVNSYEMPDGKTKLLKPLGDQIILLNPAFEAIRHYDLNQMATSIKRYPKEQRPVLSIFTSQGDWATHYVFAIGRYVPSLFDSTISHTQWRADVDAVGWFPEFITHDVCFIPDASLSKTNPDYEARRAAQLTKSVGEIGKRRKEWHPSDRTPISYSFDRFVLNPVHYTPGNPIVIASMDKSIMADHTDISNEALADFIRDYIQFCQPDKENGEK